MALLGIRTDGDAGAEAGMGHVYRSLAYAERVRAEIPNVTMRFYMRDFPEGLQKVKENGFDISILPERPSPRDLGHIFAEHPPDLLIIDTLGSTDELMSAARRHARVIITLDDLEPSAAAADIIVNGILWATRILPERFGRAKVFQGARYIQLREQFAEASRMRRVVRPQVGKILISAGGADGRGFARQLMEAVRTLPFACEVSVLAGPACHDVSALHRAAQAMSGLVKFSILENVSNMAEQLCAADIALLTGGTVMFESAACGTPAVVTCSYEHQVPQAESFAAEGAALNLGYFPEAIDLTRVQEKVLALASDRNKRQRMSEAGKGTVDGLGLERFADIVRSAIEKH